MSELSQEFKINGVNVGGDAPCYVIAEAGSNHDRDFDQAKALIDVALESGADAVKFQTFSAETISSSRNNRLTKINFSGATSLYELYKKVEMPRDWHQPLSEYAQECGITFLSTPFDEKAVDELMAVGVEAFKIASFELTHYPLLRHVAATGKPVLLSTGMATLTEIEEAVTVLIDAGCKDIGLFHCGIGYPMDPAEVNLRAMSTMSTVFGCPVGYSDHTLGTVVPTAATAMGAKLIEKHFTLSRDLPGPDHAFALEPEELSQMVESIRMAEKALGSSRKKPMLSEMEHLERGRRSLYVNRVMRKGERITEEMLAVLRPGAGMHPRYFEVVVGKRAIRDLEQFEPMDWDCICE